MSYCQQCADRDAAIADLTKVLSAERTRRLKAEEVIDEGLRVYTGNGHPLRADAEIWNSTVRKYRTQYPRVGEEQ